MIKDEQDGPDSYQVLVVDDTPESLRLLTEILEEVGYKVRSASNGRLALMSASVEAPDIILLDVNMPDMNGYEVCRCLKEDPVLKHVPVIFVSALDTTEDKVAGFTAGGVDYITKPYQSVEVLARMETHLALQGLRRRLARQNISLQQQIAERKQAEEKLQKLNELLETKVEEKTQQLRESRELLQSLIDNSPALIYLKDTECNYLLINSRYEELFNVRRDTIIGKSDYDIFPDNYADTFQGFDRQVLESKTPMTAEEVVPHDNGLHTYVSIKAPLFDKARRVYAICGISTDITERKLAEEEVRRLNRKLKQKISQLKDAQEELVRKEKLSILGQLAGGLGHEIRNPLGVMNNAVFYLKTILSDAEGTVAEYLEIISREVDNALRITTDLLDFSRTRPPQVSPSDINALVDQSLNACPVPDHLRIISHIPDGLPFVSVDMFQIVQVLKNIITNAIQAMPEGGELHIKAVRGSEGEGRRALETNFMELSIRDTGAGITSENMKKLFQPLFTTKSKGIGLGLVVCKNLVEANGGRITAESHSGKGATFKIELPISDPPF